MKEAADILNVTPRTIAFHKYSMMEQLGFKTGAELIQHAVTLGLVSGRHTTHVGRHSANIAGLAAPTCQFCQWLTSLPPAYLAHHDGFRAISESRFAWGV